MTFKPDALREDIDTAVARFHAGERQLHRGDGGRLYADAEHDERHGRLVAALHETLARVERETEAELLAVDRREDGRGADPVATLSEAELRRATSLQPFVKEDALGLVPGELQRRLKALLAAEGAAFDRPAGALWLRYVRQRLTSDTGGGSPALTPEDRLALTDLLGELGRRVAPGGGLTPAEARARRQVAREVRRHAGERVREADGTNERQRQRLAASGLYSF